MALLFWNSHSVQIEEPDTQTFIFLHLLMLFRNEKENLGQKGKLEALLKKLVGI